GACVSIKDPAGTRRSLEISGAPLLDEFGNLTAAVFHVEDVTERLRKERELMASESTLRTVVESTATGMIIVDDRMRICRVNKAAAEIFGYPQWSMLGMRLTQLVPEELRTLHSKHEANYLAAPRKRSMGESLAIVGIRRNGDRIPLAVGLSPLETVEGFQV